MNRFAVESQKIVLYKLHVVLGVLIFIFSVYRVYLKYTEKSRPDEPDKLANYSKQIQKVSFPILYYFPILISIIGIIILQTTGVLSVLNGSSTASIPINDTLPIGRAHLITAAILIFTAFLHFSGSTLYQLTKGEVYGRMGLNILSYKK